MSFTVRNARLVGALLMLLSLGVGVAIGFMIPRRDSQGMRISVTATDQMPDEIARLGLSAEQRPAIQAALRRGRDRVLAVVDQVSPRMQAVVDSTDQEIRALLTPAQRASLDSARKVDGPPLQRRTIRSTERQPTP
jgi:hypothetical protein